MGGSPWRAGNHHLVWGCSWMRPAAMLLFDCPRPKNETDPEPVRPTKAAAKPTLKGEKKLRLKVSFLGGKQSRVVYFGSHFCWYPAQLKTWEAAPSERPSHRAATSHRRDICESPGTGAANKGHTRRCTPSYRLVDNPIDYRYKYHKS